MGAATAASAGRHAAVGRRGGDKDAKPRRPPHRRGGPLQVEKSPSHRDAPAAAPRSPLRRARRCAAPTAAPATAPCPLLRPLWEGGLWLGCRCGVRFGRWALLCPRRTLVAAVSASDAGRRLVPWSPAPRSGRLSFVLVESVHDENLDHFSTFFKRSDTPKYVVEKNSRGESLSIYLPEYSTTCATNAPQETL